MKKLLVLFLCLFATGCKVTKGKQNIGLVLANPLDLAFPDATTLYVVNSNSTQAAFSNGSVSIYDISDPVHIQVSSSVLTPLFNARMAINQSVVPDRAFVSNRFSDDDLDFVDQVLVFNIQNTQAPVQLPNIATGDDPFGITIVPAGDAIGNVLVAHISDANLDYFDGNSAAPQVKQINLASLSHNGTFSSAVSVAPDGNRAVVSNIAQNLLYIIDLTAPDALTLEAVLQVTFQGLFAADFRDILWLDNSRFVVVNRAFDSLFLFDLNFIVNGANLPDDSVTEEIAVDVPGNPGTYPIFLTPFCDPLALAMTATHLYVTELNFNQVDSINLATLVLEKTIPSGGLGPAALALEPSGRYLYIANQISSNIGIIDTQTDDLVGQFP